MKLFIITDIEGVSGVTRWDHALEQGRYYDRSRGLLVGEVNAAVEGALDAGATEVVVWDAHGPRPIDPQALHSEAKLLLGQGRPDATLGMNDSFDAVFFVGQHAMNRTPRANLCHSYRISTSRMWLNDIEVGEFGLRTIVAGCMGIPVILLTGDDCACAEAQELVPGIETVAVKEGYTQQCALCLHPTKAQDLIREGARQAIARRNEISPCRVSGPWELKIESYDLAKCKEGDTGFDRPIGDTEVVTSEDFRDVAR